MQKHRLLNLFNSILISLLLLTCGFSFLYKETKSDTPALAEEYAVIEGVDHKLGKLNRFYSSISAAGEFAYMSSSASAEEFETFTPVNGKYEDPQFTMLYNADAKLDAASGLDGTAENIYFSFGLPQEKILASTDTDLTFIIDLHVSITLNGTAIYKNNTREDPDSIPQTNGSKNMYFEQYLDLTNIYLQSQSGTAGTRIPNASGLYVIEVNYQVQKISRRKVDETWVYSLGPSLERTTMKYALYILDESEYVEYPEFSHTSVDMGNRSDNGTIQYFYNYNKQDYPTYTYDASKYNVKFSLEQDTGVYEYLSYFELSEDTTYGTLTFTNTSNATDSFSQRIDKVGDRYPVTLNFTEQGIYTITNRYVVNVNNVYAICDNIVATSNLYTGVEGDGELYNSQYKLHIFGFQATFNNSINAELLMLNEGNTSTEDMLLINADTTHTIHSDVTYLFTKAELQSYNGSTKLYSMIETKLGADFANFLVASTDQPPIEFTYYGEYKYTGITSHSLYYKYTTISSVTKTRDYLRKDAYLEDPGYYEVIVNYTYSEYSVGSNIGSQVTHTQAFIFTINNASPEVQILNEDGTSVDDDGFTNQNVQFIVNPNNETSLNDNYFNAPISVYVQSTDFYGTSGTPYLYTPGTYISNNARYSITVAYGLDGIQKDDYGFTIDKTPISNVHPQAVRAFMQSSTNELLYYSFIDNADLNEYYNNSTLFNQPFTLLFDEKASGATIDVTYKRYYFSKNLTAGTIIDGINDTTYITTNYELDLSKTPQTSAYVYYRDMFNNGLADIDSVFDLDTSCLILFYLKDQAGNEYKYHIIYDLTIPYVNVTPAIQNSYNIVSQDATVSWGDYKAIKITGGDFTSPIVTGSSETFADYIDISGNNTLINSIYNQGTENGSTHRYLTIPINQIYVTYMDNGAPVENYYVKDYPNGDYELNLQKADNGNYNIYPFISSISVKTGANGETTSFEQGIFVGEHDISYNVSDKSNISSDLDDANNNCFDSNIWLNLDKSMGLGFVKVSDSTSTYGMQQSEETPINANQLRFSYIEGEDDYAVSSLTYDYYEVAASSYQEYTINASLYETNEPRPKFPYRATPSLQNQEFNIDTTIRKADEPDRLFSVIINQETIGGQTYTKSGMYVFKRVYAGAVSEDKVRYYVFYIDRTGIIDINAELLDDPSIVYEQGYGFVFDFSNDGTKFTALQIQQYLVDLTDPTETSLFNSNKLPIIFSSALDKYNTRSLLKNTLTDINFRLDEYINTAKIYNEYLFGLTLQVEVLPESNPANPNYITGTMRDILTYNCIIPGIYTITIKDNSGYTYFNPNTQRNEYNHNCNQFSFRFQITHSAPDATFHTKDLSLAVNTKESSKNGVNYQEYVSTNSKLLQLSFDRNLDPYRATIDAKNFRVYRNNSVVFSLTNNVARLNNQIIYTITNNVPMLNGNLETVYAPLFLPDTYDYDKSQISVNFEVKIVNNIVTAFLNNTLVYQYIEGVYRDAEGNVESKYSPVFKDTICTFTLENGVGMLDGEVVFILEDRIPLHNGKIASEYSNIFVFDESLNRYIITIFNANDTEHTYISNYLTEATYRVELQYEGLEGDYNYTYSDRTGTHTSNFFKKQFVITVDRTAPEYNLNQLKSSDKFHTNKNSIDTTSYFFAVNSDFVFVKQNELETNEIFYRYLGPAGPMTFTYEYTIVPDNPIYNTGELSNHQRFMETATIDGVYIYNPTYFGKASEGLLAGPGYYEIIERDEAMNYRVYAVYFDDPSAKIDFIYDQAESNGIQSDQDENLADTSNPYTIKGAITDNTGKPLSDITVKIIGTDITTTTDVSGEFIFNDLVGVNTLQFISSNYSFIPATKKVNELNYSYDEANMDQITLDSHYISITAYAKIKGSLALATPDVVAAGQNLVFDLTPISSDQYMKAIINGSDGSTKEIVNTPDLINGATDPKDELTAWAGFISELNEYINTFSTDNSYGFKYNIEFINRFGENYHLTYVLPGIMLTPSIVETVPNSKFTFTIPEDPSGTTYIRRIEVRKFSGGENWTIIARDSTNKTISTYNDGKPLDITTYTFMEGEYMFTLTDNFNRVSVHYKGVGVNDVRTIDYGINATIGGITYTASSVSLSYQTALYKLKVVEINADGTRTDITNALRVNGVNEISNINNVRKLEFTNYEIQGEVVNEVVMDGIRQFEVSLYVEKLDLTYTYKFVINRTNPNINLLNISGEKLKETSNIVGDPTIHTEDFLISWDATDPLLFNPKVRLTRTYFEDNQEKVEVINNITNGYRIVYTGTYKAEIYNSLGFSDPNKTIYFKRIDGNIVMYSVVKVVNSKETELAVSNDMPNVFIGGATGESAPLYKYYALMYETTINGVTTTTYDTVEIRVNPSKGLVYKRVTEDDETPIYDKSGNQITAESNVYRIYGAEGENGTVSYGYDQYIQIVYILSSSDFVKATISTETHDHTTPSTTLGQALKHNIKDTSDYIDISFPAFNLDKGNPIFLDYSFNGTYVETISNTSGQLNTLRLTNAGIYSLTFYDLAGNIQKYSFTANKANSFTISLINNVLYTINNNNPVQNEIFNSEVVLEIINKQLYDAENVDIKAKRNGKEIKLVNSEDSYDTYIFKDQGYYTITMTATVTGDIASGTGPTAIKTEYNFIIVNEKQAQRSFNIPLNKDFTITRVLRENVNITNTLSNNKELWLSAGDEKTGSGIYTITISAYVPQTKTYRSFTFKVWINDEVPVIISSLDFGKDTTKQITLSFNKNLIYQQIGDSIIRISGMADIIINEDTATENIRESITLVQNREYTIQVLTADGKVITSYKLIKKEPLNTVSIIIIVISSVVAIGLVITFIMLRKHIKYR